MRQTGQTARGLPLVVHKIREEFCNQLQGALGDSLVAVVLQGDLAKGESFDTRTSPVNMMVVLKKVTVEFLDKIASPVPNGLRRVLLRRTKGRRTRRDG